MSGTTEPVESPTHAGGVVYRREDGTRRYLLVTAKRSGDWVLPKGHIEAHEPPEQAALREVREETGVVAELRARIPGRVQFTSNGERTEVVFFVMAYLRDEPPLEERLRRWLGLEQALQTATHAETRRVLCAADAIAATLDRA